MRIIRCSFAALAALGALNACGTEPADTPASSATTSPSETAVSAPPAGIAADFPLAQNLLNDDHTPALPSGDSEGVLLPIGFCAPEAWPAAAPDDRLAVEVTGPEYRYARELVTFTTADAAVAALGTVRGAAEACPVARGDRRSNDQLLEVHPADTGYDSVVISSVYREGLGGSVYEFVRVGRALLASQSSAEYGPESIASGVAYAVEQNAPIVDLLCPFTTAGC